MNISIVMATYNGEKYIKEQLDSIIPFLKPSDELIISDDNSKDDTLTIIKSYVNERPNIKLLAGPCKGVVKNFENALFHVTGDICMFADQDDIWLPEKLDTIRDYFEKHQVDLTLHDMFLASNEEIQNKTYKIKSFNIRRRRHGYIYNLLFNGYYGCCMAFKTTFIKKIIPFPESTTMYDQLIGLYAEKNAQVDFINIPLIIHRKHGDNMSQKESFIGMVMSRFELYKSLSEIHG